VNDIPAATPGGRKLFVQINMSLDGYIEDSSGDIDWRFADDEFDEFILETLQSIDGMVFGRVAFDKLASYWPNAGQEPDLSERQRAAVRLMNDLPKYLVSDRPHRTSWSNSHVITGDVPRRFAELKAQPGKDIALFAGANTAMSFSRLGLVDEYRIILNPAVLGSGTPLFTGDYLATQLSLLDVRRFTSGALVLRYLPSRRLVTEKACGAVCQRREVDVRIVLDENRKRFQTPHITRSWHASHERVAEPSTPTHQRRKRWPPRSAMSRTRQASRSRRCRVRCRCRSWSTRPPGRGSCRRRANWATSRTGRPEG